MSILPPPLLRRRSLLAGESLPSLLMRLTKINHYDLPYILVGLALEQGSGKGYARDISANISQSATFERLEALTKIEGRDLYASTSHRFASVMTPPEVAIESLSISDTVSFPLLARGVAHVHLRPEYAVQFCPTCLGSQAYHRLIWTPVATAACLQHKCLLVNRCPECNRTISIRDLVGVCCSNCGCPFTRAQPPSIEHDAFGLFSQHVIQSWLLDTKVPDSENFSLLEQLPRVLYRFLSGLRVALMAVESEWPYFHTLQIGMHPPTSMKKLKPQSLAPHQSYCLYATALKAIVNWPAGFYEFLDAYRTVSTKSKHIGHAVGYDLGKLYAWFERYWQHELFAFAQNAFNTYLIENYSLSHEVVKSGRYRNNRKLFQNFSTMTLVEAAKTLHTTPKIIKFLIHQGHLTGYISSDAHKYPRLDRFEVQKMSQKWLNCIGLSEVSQRLGISQDFVLNLVQVGLLVADRSPEEGFVHWIFSKSAVEECLDKIVKNVELCNENDPKVDSLLHLFVASKILGAKIGLNAAQLLLQVAQGRSLAYCLPTQSILLSDLLFDRPDIEQCAEAFLIDRNLLGRQEAQNILGVSDTTFSCWVRRGLIPDVSPRKLTQYFDRSVVNSFLSQHVKTDEAANILGISRLAIQNMAREGYLEAISGPGVDGLGNYLFNRKKLSEWRSYWLNDTEVFQLLTIDNRGILNRWVKQGRIEVLVPSNGYRRWFSKQSVLELLKTMSESEH